MSGCGRSSRRAFPKALALFLLGIAILGAGCAAPRAAAPPASAPAPPAKPAATPVSPPAEERTSEPRLPGADRLYPSQEEKNQASADAPEAFPIGGSAASGRVAVKESGKTKDSAEAKNSGDGKALVEAKESGDRTDSVEARAPAADSAPPSRKGRQASKPEGAGFMIQLLATTSRLAAEAKAGALERAFEVPVVVVKEGGLFKLRVGPVPSRGEAEKVRRRAAKLGYRDAFITPPRAVTSS